MNWKPGRIYPQLFLLLLPGILFSQSYFSNSSYQPSISIFRDSIFYSNLDLPAENEAGVHKYDLRSGLGTSKFLTPENKDVISYFSSIEMDENGLYLYFPFYTPNLNSSYSTIFHFDNNLNENFNVSLPFLAGRSFKRRDQVITFQYNFLPGTNHPTLGIGFIDKSAGALDSVKMYEIPEAEYLNAGETIQDKNGDFITIGNLSSGGFIVRYDTNGNPILSKYFESFNFDSVDTLSGGGYLVSSRSKDPFIFGDRKLVLLELDGSFEITGSRVLEIPFAFPRGHFKFDENGNGILMASFSANRTIVIKFDPRFDLDYAYQFPVEFNIANVSSFNLPNEHLFIYGSNRNLSYAAILDENGLLPNCRGNEICFELIEGAKPQGKIFQMVPISPPQVEAPTYIVKDTVGFEWKEDCLPSNYVPGPGFLVKDTFCTNEFLSLIDTTAKWIDQSEWRIEDSVFNKFVFTDTAGFLLESPGQLEISQKIWFNGCPDSISKIIEVVVPPRLSLGSDTLLCFGEELILNPEISGALTFVWENQPDSLLQNRSVSTSGTYIGRASNNGCFVKDSIIVDFFQANLASFEIQLSNDTINCVYPHIVAGFSGADPLTWKFENDSINLDSILISQPGLYQIVINQDPCEAIRSFDIFEEKCSRDIYFPSAFSPNADGINDFFRPYGDKNILIEELLIFDRWGNLLFKKENLDPGLNDEDFWDGSFRGERLNPSILVWSASLIWPDGSKERLKGDVSLVR